MFGKTLIPLKYEKKIAKEKWVNEREITKCFFHLGKKITMITLDEQNIVFKNK